MKSVLLEVTTAATLPVLTEDESQTLVNLAVVVVLRIITFLVGKIKKKKEPQI